MRKNSEKYWNDWHEGAINETSRSDVGASIISIQSGNLHLGMNRAELAAHADAISTCDGFTFTRLISPAEVAKEGHTQRHCVGVYIGTCQSGRYPVYKVKGKERATLGLHIQDGTHWGLDQLYGACNSHVSDACRSAAMDLIHDDEFRRKWAA